jgi:hypothetical protein
MGKNMNAVVLHKVCQLVMTSYFHRPHPPANKIYQLRMSCNFSSDGPVNSSLWNGLFFSLILLGFLHWGRKLIVNGSLKLA